MLADSSCGAGPWDGYLVPDPPVEPAVTRPRQRLLQVCSPCGVGGAVMIRQWPGDKEGTTDGDVQNAETDEATNR